MNRIAMDLFEEELTEIITYEGISLDTYFSTRSKIQLCHIKCKALFKWSV
jgi:hypothetical protein